MKRAMLTSKNCKQTGYFYQKIIPTDVAVKSYYGEPVPFKFGFINTTQDYNFVVPQIRVRAYKHYIHAFRDLGFKVDDQIKFDNKVWNVIDINQTYYESGTFNSIQHYFITLS